jgi:cation transport regulator ChaB
MHTAPDIDIRKIKLTGNEKRFNDIRSNFYQILESAETFKQREILEKKPKYTNFLKNLNREQFKIPKKQEREAVKSEMYEFILNDQISHKVMTDDYKREAILDLKRELRDNLSRMAGPDDPQFYDKQFRSSLLGYKDEGKLRNNSENREKN